MHRKRFSLVLSLAVIAVALGWWARVAFSTPPAWRALQGWAASAEPGALLTGNAELASVDGRQWPPVRTQEADIPFLFSDNPEYLYHDSVGKGLARMTLPGATPFGVGWNHINKTVQAQPLQLLVQSQAKRPVTVRLLRGAYGFTTGNQQIMAGRQCAIAWFSAPNIRPAAVTLRPGEARALYTYRLAPSASMNAMCDLETSGAVAVYMLFGKTPPPSRLRYAPYGLTIGTASGSGKYWKRVLRPAPGTPAFDAANTRHGNEVRLRFAKLPPAGQQYLVDETWEQRPENQGKTQIRAQGGGRRPYKGDYNVVYTVQLPVYARTGHGRFAVIFNQRTTPGKDGMPIKGIYTGAAKTRAGMVPIPRAEDTLLRPSDQGVLLDVVSVNSAQPTTYTLHWMMSGGSYCDQDFVLVPLP